MMSIAGVVVYEIDSRGSLEGRWTHPDLGGKLAVERADPVTAGPLVGEYRVQIELPDGSLVFEGTLAIAALEDAFRLVWSGHRLLPTREPARYTGVGMRVAGGVLVASFQDAGGAGAGCP